MALSEREQVEELAKLITAFANAIHAYLLEEIKAGRMNRDEARTHFDNETFLREIANSLYIDAASYIISDLEMAQEELLSVINKAKGKIKKIQKISAFVELVADMLVFVSAVRSATPKEILNAIKKIRKDVAALE